VGGVAVTGGGLQDAEAPPGLAGDLRGARVEREAGDEKVFFAQRFSGVALGEAVDLRLSADEVAGGNVVGQGFGGGAAGLRELAA